MKSESHLLFVYNTLQNMIPCDDGHTEYLAKATCNTLAYVLEIDPPYEDMWENQSSTQTARESE